MVELAEVGVHFNVVENVVHPPHVPLQVKAQAALQSPLSTGWETRGQAVDSSAIIITSLWALKMWVLSCWRNSTASRFSCPPNTLAPTGRPAGRSPGRAWRPPHPPEGRRCGTAPARTGRRSRGRTAPRFARSQTPGCPSRRAPPGVGILVAGLPVKLVQAEGVLGKWAGTQSRMTPMPAWWS